MKKIIIIFIIAIVLFNIFILSNVPNRADVIKEQIIAIQSEIKEQEKHMMDLINDIISYVEKYDKEKAEMLKRVVEARGIGSDKLIEHIIGLIENVAENNPELQNSSEYKMMMKELTTLQELIANTRNIYNSCIDKYNDFIEKFKEILDILGYKNENYNAYEN